MRFETQLPINDVIDSLVETLREKHELILEAPPGAGKTSIVPLAILKSGLTQGKKIYVLQPRRMAARASAERMAELLDESVGDSVGYQIRLESKVGPNTKIIVMTEGVYLRLLQSDPSLDNVGLVIFDEFHERSLDSDLSLSLSLHARAIFREEDPLKLLLMSATLNGDDIAAFLSHAPVIRSEGRQYPVEENYLSREIKENTINESINSILRKLSDEPKGDILVFLPGRAEIKRLIENASPALSPYMEFYALYGGLSSEKQRAVITSQSKKTRVIVATDIAETSLTIEGITTVIDSGLCRVPKYKPSTGVTALETQRISLASAKQRAGRAGRLGPGVCYRLWTEGQHKQLHEYAQAEIINSDMSNLLLLLLAWGVATPAELEWLTPPPKGNIKQAESLLINLDAVTKDQNTEQLSLTDHGKAMSELPCHPRIAHMILRATEKGWATLASQIAALLSERDTLTFLGIDFYSRIEIVNNKREIPKRQNSWLRRIDKQTNNFLQLLKKQKQLLTPDENTAALCIALAFPDRIAKRINKTEGLYKLSNGRNVSVPIDDPIINSDWFVVVDLGGYSYHNTDRVFSAIRIEKNIIESELKHLIIESRHCCWQKEQGRIIAEDQRHIGKILLEQKPSTNISPQDKLQATLNFIKEQGLDVLPWNRELRFWQQRALLIREFYPNENWPKVDDLSLLENIENWLGLYVTKIENLEQLKKIDLQSALSALLDWQQQKLLDKRAPETITVPSGSNKRIDYSQKPPVLAVKLQEMFGCESTPCIADGQLALMVHLLSPAQRPLQITQDLAGFWRSSYFEIKKELKGRYPKHPWPDDPLTAMPTKSTKKKMQNNKHY